MTGKATRKEFSIPGLNPPISHYCDAVAFGNLLFISGIGPLDSNLKVIGGDDVAAQAEAVFAAMEKVLKAAGASFADVLKVTVYLTDVDDRTKINPVRQRYFGDRQARQHPDRGQPAGNTGHEGRSRGCRRSPQRLVDRKRLRDHRHQRLEAVGLGGGLVPADAVDARKAHGDAGLVAASSAARHRRPPRTPAPARRRAPARSSPSCGCAPSGRSAAAPRR